MHAHDGVWEIKPGGGGLVQALDPVLRERGGLWVGWPGVASTRHQPWEPLIEQESRRRGYRFAPVLLDAALVEGFYGGFANGVLWPLFHNLDLHAAVEPSQWQAYEIANRRFAAEVMRSGGEGLVWVHDYQLIRVGEELRFLDPSRRIAFFLHIPFPPFETFVKLPQREELLAALLSYDYVGFQTELDKHCFLECVAQMLPHALVREVGREGLIEADPGGRGTRVGAHPIGIDFRGVSARATSAAVTRRLEQIRGELGAREVLIGVDRLDYTKGILERLAAFRALFERAPELREKVTLVQLVEPSRELVPEYQELKLAVERMVGKINGELGTTSWVPVQYFYRSVAPTDLYALYRLASVALVTPLRDGMNLVAKEYCACQIDAKGALVLSEFAGAAAQLRAGAFVVNPYDVEATAAAIHSALILGPEERHGRMRALRNIVAAEDVFWWTRRFLAAALPERESFQEPAHLGGAP